MFSFSCSDFGPEISWIASDLVHGEELPDGCEDLLDIIIEFIKQAEVELAKKMEQCSDSRRYERLEKTRNAYICTRIKLETIARKLPIARK